jgi:hypothetical protein
MYVRDPDAAWAVSIIDGVDRHKHAGVPVPDHLVELAKSLPAEPGDVVVLVDDDFGIPPPPFASAEPMTGPPDSEPDAEQPSLWDDEQAEGVDLEGWTVTELKAALDDLEVDYPASARKAELIALLEEAEG